MPTSPVSVDRTPLHRRGAGEPLVLLHGATMSWHFWAPVLDDLERHHEVIAPTLLGHAGGSPWTVGTPASVDQIVDNVCEQLDEQGVETAHLAGHSLGGWVALELVRRGRARTAVVLSPAGTFRSPRDLRRVVTLFRLGLRFTGPAWVTEAAEQAAGGPGARMLMHQMMEHGERASADEIGGFFADLAACSIIDDFLSGLRAGDAMRSFPSLPCRVRVAWSARDRILPWPRCGAPMRAKLPGAEFYSLPGCGHVPVWDDPELVVRTILQVTAAASYDPGAPEWSVPENALSARPN